MSASKFTTGLLALIFFLLVPSSPVFGDKLRGVKLGHEVPRYEMRAIDGTVVKSRPGRVLVLVYLSAEQRSSELAATDASEVVAGLKGQPVDLLFVTADVVHKAYFQKFWEEEGITAPLALDSGRKLYGKLGLIVFPTTLVIDRERRLAHVISMRGLSYRHLLGSYVRHALGLIDDAKLEERLEKRTFDPGSPMSRASRHRVTARLLMEKGGLDGALKELETALELDPDNIQIRLDMADLYLVLGNVDRSERIIDEVLEAEPMHRRAKLLKGMVLFETGRLDEAEVILTEGLVLNPEPARIHYYLAQIYEKKGDKDRAMEHYREAIGRLLGPRAR